MFVLYVLCVTYVLKRCIDSNRLENSYYSIEITQCDACDAMTDEVRSKCLL